MSHESTEEIQSVRAQVATLKRLATLAVGVAVAAVALAGGALGRSGRGEWAAGPPALEVSELTIRDPAGNVRGRWSVQGLSLVDTNGRLRAGLSVSDEGAPSLTLFSRNGGVRAVISLGSEDSPGITLHDGQSRVRTRIGVGSENASSLVIVNQTGDVIGRFPAPAATPAVTARTGR